MKEQSGRSLIEIVGVLAIGVIMIAAAYNMYRSIDQRQERMITYEDVKEIARKTKILYEYSGYPSNLTASTLVTAGAITSTKLPVGTLEVASSDGGKEFTVKIKKITRSECKYFSTKKSDDWAYEKSVDCKTNASSTATTSSVTFKVK